MGTIGEYHVAHISVEKPGKAECSTCEQNPALWVVVADKGGRELNSCTDCISKAVATLHAHLTL